MPNRYILWPNDSRATVLANLHRAIDATPDDAAYVWERRKYVKPRSNPQNSVLWGVIYPPIMEAMGLRGERDREDLHEFWCGEYFGWVESDIMGKRKQHPRRTTTTDEDGKRAILSTLEFQDFCEFIRQRAAEHGIVVPDPEPPQP